MLNHIKAPFGAIFPVKLRKMKRAPLGLFSFILAWRKIFLGKPKRGDRYDFAQRGLFEGDL